MVTVAKRKPKKRKPKKPDRPPRARGATAPDSDALTLNEQVFLQEYLLTDNKTEAYRKAFPGATYSAARSEGCRLSAKPNIRREIDAYRAEQRRRFRATAARVIMKRAELAFSDIGDVIDFTGGIPSLKDRPDIPKAARQAIKSVARTRDGVKVTMHDQPASLRALELHLGLANELPPLEQLLALLPPDLAARVRAALAPAPREEPSAQG